MNIEEFADTVHNVHMTYTQYTHVPSILTKEVMIMDVDGDLVHFKNISFDEENDCFIISTEI